MCRLANRKLAVLTGEVHHCTNPQQQINAWQFKQTTCVNEGNGHSTDKDNNGTLYTRFIDMKENTALEQAHIWWRCAALLPRRKKPKWNKRNHLKLNSRYIFQSGCNACHSLSHCRCRWSCHVILQLGSCHLRNERSLTESKRIPTVKLWYIPPSLYSFPVSTLANK